MDPSAVLAFILLLQTPCDMQLLLFCHNLLLPKHLDNRTMITAAKCSPQLPQCPVINKTRKQGDGERY